MFLFLFRMARSDRSSRGENPKKRPRLSNGSKSLNPSTKKRTKTHEKSETDKRMNYQGSENENELLLGWSPVRIIRIPET